ncbi:hypothetical protein SGQ83_03520 [Flavobacterium sp. Fl-318]|uniref:Phospholipase/carboxylesterase/thioesterase domain-containing protein n=1 Tax=Flavobacterium cupriresistens TaxID=2893885 RepID=A0ABU4R743_9FLAO|nr:MULTISPECIES: hypothetical protein [unclassified Flavobacterium]MDX6188407.1 hypothetical protein [Flavobacterium sp. Fl-318]UFH44922.1 hypothetical protein LNP23_12130 [Flavobacterium sp. F-323]
MKNTIYSILFLFVTVFGYTQEKQLLPTGVIIDSVKITTAPTESYALYFPKKYDAKTPLALVFIFEPDARGKIGIEPFILAAETYHYILVCSNTLRNGSIQDNIAVANRLFEDVLQTYAIDTSQLYIAGFSGGARLASYFGISTGAFQGVIACGASFNNMDKFIPPSNKFSYVGMVGDRDMNYQEMIGNKQWLDNTKMVNTLFISHEEHVWPKQSEMLRAFDWLEIQAYRKNIRPKNDTISKRIYDVNVQIADSLKANKEMVSSMNAYEKGITFFNTNEDNFLRAKIAEIKKTREYKEEVTKMEKINILENKLLDKLSLRFDQELKSAKGKANFKFWKSEIKDLKMMKSDDKNPLLQNMVVRVLYWFQVSVYETGQESKRNQQNDKFAYCEELYKIITEAD